MSSTCVAINTDAAFVPLCGPGLKTASISSQQQGSQAAISQLPAGSLLRVARFLRNITRHSFVPTNFT